METIPTTSRSLDRYYHINGDTFEKQYKEVLSGYREWSELSHAEDWLVFPENIGESICIDETAPSNGELYTIVSNRSSRGGKGTIIAIVRVWRQMLSRKHLCALTRTRDCWLRR